MRKGFNGLAALAEEVLKQDPYAGISGVPWPARRSGQGDLARRPGVCLFTKRLERGRFIWPIAVARPVTITPAQLSIAARGDRLARAAADLAAAEVAG